MRRILLIGRSESGKTTLKQVLRGENITYKKTQYVSQYDCVIDMPGEYAENLDLAHTIDLYAAESDVVGIVLSATEPYSLYPPNITPLGNRDEVGIVTKIDHWAANPQQAAEWLKLIKKALESRQNFLTITFSKYIQIYSEMKQEALTFVSYTL